MILRRESGSPPQNYAYQALDLRIQRPPQVRDETDLGRDEDVAGSNPVTPTMTKVLVFAVVRVRSEQDPERQLMQPERSQRRAPGRSDVSSPSPGPVIRAVSGVDACREQG